MESGKVKEILEIVKYRDNAARRLNDLVFLRNIGDLCITSNAPISVEPIPVLSVHLGAIMRELMDAEIKQIQGNVALYNKELEAI